MSVSDCELRADEAIRDTWRVRDLGFNAVILGTPACREWEAPFCWRLSSPPQLAALASLGRTLQAPGCAAHSGRAAEPPKAQCEAVVRP